MLDVVPLEVRGVTRVLLPCVHSDKIHTRRQARRAISRRPLTLGTPVTETISGSGQSQYFQLNVTQPGTILLTLQDTASGDENELYANYGIVPTPRHFHPWFATGASASQQLSIPATVPGTYYVLVYNLAASASGQSVHP